MSRQRKGSLIGRSRLFTIVCSCILIATFWHDPSRAAEPGDDPCDHAFANINKHLDDRNSALEQVNAVSEDVKPGMIPSEHLCASATAAANRYEETGARLREAITSARVACSARPQSILLIDASERAISSDVEFVIVGAVLRVCRARK